MTDGFSANGAQKRVAGVKMIPNMFHKDKNRCRFAYYYRYRKDNLRGSKEGVWAMEMPDYAQYGLKGRFLLFQV